MNHFRHAGSGARLRRIMTALMFTVAIMAQAKIYLVAAGISDYPGEANDLKRAAGDANAVAWLYDKSFDAEYILLTNSNATADNVVKAMDRLYAKAGKDDAVVFFYSGHGYKGGFCLYDNNLSYDKVRKSMAKSHSTKKMIFADACHAGGMRRNPSKQQGTKPNSADTSANVMLFLSSRGDESSFELGNLDFGLFTTHLIDGLKGGADTNSDRKVSAKELFDYVSLKVKKGSSDRQHPVMWGKFPDTMEIVAW